MQPGDLKNIGYASPTSWLQNVDYRYNIRGWLMSINNSKLTPDGGKTNYDSNDVFGMQLMYDKADSALSNSHYFNGKPSGIKWMTRYGNNTRTPERSFLFTYDGFNRYTAETYAERDSLLAASNPFNQNVHGFDENSITYNANGNLLTLKRNSSVIGAGSHKQIDSLVYSYNANSLNQLLKVTDGTDSVHAGHGFRSIDSTANYSYDSNGNLFNDHFKGMELRYDVLNRTDKITVTTASGQYIDYTYDADGNLLRKRAYSGGMLQTTTDYIDGFVYITVTTGTPALSYFPMPEGRVVNVSGALTQEFIMTDQQGNARVAFRNVGGIAKVYQENSYYGTGLILPNSPVGAPAVPNKKLYNGGSEWQNDSPVGATYPYNLPDYYETYNRNYDATIGRFIGVDPMAESAESMTSYQYGGGNPIIANDPSGALLTFHGNQQVTPITAPGGENGFEQEIQESGLPSSQQLFDQLSDLNDADVNDEQINQENNAAQWQSIINGGTILALGLNGSSLDRISTSTNALRDIGNALDDPDQTYNMDIYRNGVAMITLPHSGNDNSNATYYAMNGGIEDIFAGGQAGYPVGLKNFIAIASGEAAGSRIDAAMIGSTMINRMIAAGTDLNDPNWEAESIHVKGLGGTVKGNYQILQTPNQYEYSKVMNMSIDDIMDSNLPYIVGAREAYFMWGAVDFSNGAMKWSATATTPEAQARDANYRGVAEGTLYITTAGFNTTFFGFK